MIRALRSADISARSQARVLAVSAAALAVMIVGAVHPASAQVPSTRIINTVAGTGTQGFSGDGGPATAAMVSNANGVAVDGAGNLYIADGSSNRIRKVSAATGIITTVAGNGADGYSGDGGLATEAELGWPQDVAVDADGNLYISQPYRYVIRKVTAATGRISTIAGTGVAGYNGDGIQATTAELGAPYGVIVGSDGHLYIGEPTRVRQVNLTTGVITTVAGNGSTDYTGDGGPATAAGLYGAYALAMDGDGNLFIGASGQNVVRKVDATTQRISTVAGTGGTQGFAGDGGPATDALLSWVTGVALDASGNLYLVDAGNARIRRVDAVTTVITTVAGVDIGLPGDGGPASLAWLQDPHNLVSDFAGNLVFGERARVRHISSDVAPATTSQAGDQSVLVGETATFTVAITGIPQPALVWQFSSNGGTSFVDLVDAAPYSGVATPTLTITGTPFSLNGYLYRMRATNIWGEARSDPGSLTVAKRTPVITWANPAAILPGTVLGGTQLNAAASVAGSFVYEPPAGTAMATGAEQWLKATFTPADPATYAVVVRYVVIDVIGANNEGARIITTIAGSGSTFGGFSGDGGPATEAQFHSPWRVMVDGTGDLYIPDTGNHRIRKIAAATGVITTVAGTGTAGFNGDGLAATATQLNFPTGLARDAWGNLYVADKGNQRVRKIDAITGAVTTVAGTGTAGFSGDGGPATAAAMQGPHALAFDTNENLYILDSDNALIRKVSASTGIITTIAGGGWLDPGDGELATSARISDASALAFDAAGDLFLAAYNQQRIRMVSAATGIITTVAGTGTYGASGDGGLPTAAELGTPTGLDFDAAGNVYIAEYGNNRIRKITAATGLITSIAGTGAFGFAGDGGPAMTAQFRSPGGVTADGATLYISDGANHRIRKIATGAAPAFASHPPNIGTDVGGTATFTAGVSGYPAPAVKWQVSPNGTTWTDLTNTAPYSGVATPSLTITGAPVDLNGRMYHVVATNSIGTATSNTATLTVTTSTKETPVITWANPAGIVYGTALGATQLNATANTPGTFAYTPTAGTLLQAGARTLSVLFTPNDAAHYNSATADVSIAVTQATPVVTWANPASIVYGTALGATQLNATASVAGAFLYTPAAGAVLSAGPHTLSVTFTPTDGVNYAVGAATATIVVTQATPSITWATPANIVYGTPLGGAQLNATASTAGTFVYSQPPGTILGAGSHSLVADFTPTDAANYTTASANVLLNVMQYTPVITWASPAPILHGTALSAVQLNATANVPGTISYWPLEGTVLGIGAAQDLRAYFTPADPINYAYAIRATTIDVNPSGPIITTIAGVTGVGGFSGDGGAALAAEFNQPNGVAVDLAGNVFVADAYNYRIRKITAATGVISTVAGSGGTAPLDGGYSGDGGPATSARFWWTPDVAVDGGGNLYIADPSNRRIRKVTAATGIVTTVAGNGLEGATGDGGPATSARLGYASVVTLDGAGNLYIADYTNSRIRKVAAATGIITNLVGTGVIGYLGDGGPATDARLYYPYGIAVDLAGNLYIADTYNNRVRKVSAATGVITTVAGNGTEGFSGDGGTGTAAALDTPTRVAVDGAGNLYINDAGNYRIRKVDASTGIITTVAGTGIYNSGAVGDGEEATRAGLGLVGGISVDAAGNLYLAGSDSGRIRKITALAAPTYWLTVAPAPTHGRVTGGGISCGTGGTTCQAGFASATSVTLTATPDPDYLFTGWSGACSGTDPTATVDVGAATTCTAAFAAAAPPDGPPYTLTITPPAGGKVQGAGINCGAGGTACTVTMPVAMSIGLAATPSAGYTFTAWTGDCSGATPAYLVALNGARACGALFAPAGGTPAYQLTIAPVPTGGVVSGHGLACAAGGGACQVAFGVATAATLTATPSSGYAFTSWGGACSGTSLTTGVLVDAARTCTATFTATGGGPVTGPPYTLTVTPAAGGVIRAAGIACGAGGTACTVTMPAAMSIGLEATPSAGYTFTAWTGDCSGATPAYLLALNGARTCSAIFTPVGGASGYQLWIEPIPTGGTVTVNGTADCGDGGVACRMAWTGALTATLTASASPGYTFTNWGGACSGTNPSTTVLVDAVRTCSATFTATGGGPVTGPPYTLTIALPAGGKVQGAGINCGAGGTACTVTMPAAMSIGLAATPSAGYTFTAWTGNCSGATPAYTLALNGARTCSAIFTPAGGTPAYQLTIAPAPTGGVVSGHGLACGAGGGACQVAFGAATAATLTATPSAGYGFTSWGGACGGTSLTTGVLVDAARTCTATFTATGGGPVTGPPYTLTVTPAAGGVIRAAGIACGGGGTACTVTMPAAMSIGLEATPSAGYTFTAWTGDCSGATPAYLLALNGARTCSAVFTPSGGGGH